MTVNALCCFYCNWMNSSMESIWQKKDNVYVMHTVDLHMSALIR